jgi:uncharacterized repeat protein (TIGR03803 family)
MKTRNLRRRTSNIEHSTSNFQLPGFRRRDRHKFSAGGWAFDSACSMLLLTLLSSSFFLLPSSLAHTQAGVILTTLYSFTDTSDGAIPIGGLVQGSDGYFYGKTSGTVFKISTNGVLTTLYTFTVESGGYSPGGLVQGSDGNFYGTTEDGGTYGDGTVFQISTNGVFTNLYSFNGTDGANPQAGLVQGRDGYFYGTTSEGGDMNQVVFGAGTVFKISTNGELTTLYSFTGESDGYSPGGLVQGGDGNLYGTTFGMTRGVVETTSLGTVFKISTDGALTTLYSFTGGNDGSYPEGALARDSDGNFYGTTQGGAGWPASRVFKITPNGVETTLCVIPDDTMFPSPGQTQAGLVHGSDGNFYGATEYTLISGHGPYGSNTLFQVSANGAYTSLYSVDFPYSGFLNTFSPVLLVQGSDGNFYGEAGNDGTNLYGSVFRLTIVPEFQAVTLTNSTLNLTWSTEAGGMYQLQYTSDLSSSNWSNLGSAVTATGATLSTTDSLTNGPQRFYRLALLP